MGKRRLQKGRSSRTYSNILRRLKKYYRLTFKHSQEQKKQNEKKGYKNPNKKYFCDKFPTEKSFLDKIKIKQASREKPSSRSLF